MDFQARELLDAELCTPQCLLARDSFGGMCQCRCKGRYHGTLSDAVVEEQQVRPPSARKYPHPDWCDRDDPEPTVYTRSLSERLHQGPGHTHAHHRGTVAALRWREDVMIEVHAQQSQCIEHGWCTRPEFRVCWTKREEDEHWFSNALLDDWLDLDLWDARAVAVALARSGAGDSWLATALFRATELFGPADADGNLWNVRDDLLKMDDAWERDHESDPESGASTSSR